MARTYRVGIIGRTGKGNYGHGLDVVWKGVKACQVVAVADDNKSALPAAMTRTGARKAYVDYREMLAHYPGAKTRVIEGSDHGISEFADYVDDVLAFCDGKTS